MSPSLPNRDAAVSTGKSSRSKRDQILQVATECFGSDGYDATMLVDVAAAVGIGTTALYHYFESKLHCLFVVMGEGLNTFQANFDRITSEHDDYPLALLALLRSSYDLTDHEVLRNRVIVAEQGLLGASRTSQREEEARTLARGRIRDIQFAWSSFLVRGMEQGLVPEADPRLLARGVLGLYSSVWQWYRPRGSLSLDEVAAFFVPRQLALLGLPPEAADDTWVKTLVE
jgi:TetR/AcrR family transcriptional regulator, cholesterol catabolism regulator